MENMATDDLYLLRDRSELAVGHRLDDSHLTTHYDLITACAHEVHNMWCKEMMNI